MPRTLSPATEPRFFFLMPVWGKTYIKYLLTFGLPTLLAPNNLPWLPNRAVSQFTFITRPEDEKHIRASKLFATLEALIPTKFLLLDFYKSDRQRKYTQLGIALEHGASEALGLGYCLFFHPDGLYSDGMVKHLYGVARSGKKVCVTHGSNVTLEKVVPYLRERSLLTFDEVSPIAPRVLARALMENLHPDNTVHCLDNPQYPVAPYMGFWLSPKLDGALFRYVSLHPWLVDLRHLSELVDIGAIDHNFVRAQGYIWSDIHIETDSDKILVLGIKSENERNAIPNPRITHDPVNNLARVLYLWSNCQYSRLCFFHGMKVHTGDLDRDWHEFEVANLRWLNKNINAKLEEWITIKINRNLEDMLAPRLEAPKYFVTVLRKLPRMMFKSLARAATWFLGEFYMYYVRLIASVQRKFFRYLVSERRPLEALKYFVTVLRKLPRMIFKFLAGAFRVGP